MEDRELSAVSEIFGKLLINEGIVPLTAWFHENNLTPITYNKEIILEETDKSYKMRLLINLQPEEGGDIINVMLLGNIYTYKEIIHGTFQRIEIGLIEDFSVPRGVYFIKKPRHPDVTRVLGNEGDHPEIKTFNPLQSLLDVEIENGKKSKMISIFNKLHYTRYLLVTPRGSKTIITVGIMNEFYEKRQFEGEIPFPDGQKPLRFKMYAPDYRPLSKVMELLSQLRSVSKRASVPYAVNSGILTFINNQIDEEVNQILSVGYSLSLHLAMCLERESESGVSLRSMEGYSIPSESERESYLAKLEEKESL